MWLLPVFSALSKLAAGVFYRLQIVGPEVPTEGPVLLLANHPNSLLDPALVAAAADRPVRFLAKSTLFTDPRVGWLVRGSGSIPVYRRSDDAAASERNVDMFAAVFEQLGSGAAVGIFPEGISHDEPALARLKTGSARIALGAYASHGAIFPIIPVGLVLRQKGVFRSPALVVRGAPVDWADLGGRAVENHAAVRELTERIAEALRAVTVNLEQWEDRPLIEAATAVWSSEFGGRGSEVEQLQRSQTAARVLADLRRAGDERATRLAREVHHHRRRLERLGLDPGDLAARVDLATGASWTIRRLPLLIPPLIVIAIVSALVFWAPYHLTDWIVATVRPHEVQRSTFKVLIGALVHWAWILLIAGLAGWLGGPWTALGSLLILPPLGLAGQWVRERWRGAWSDARRFFLLRSRRELHQQLIEEQQVLAARLHQAYEDWRNEQAAPG